MLPTAVSRCLDPRRRLRRNAASASDQRLAAGRPDMELSACANADSELGQWVLGCHESAVVEADHGPWLPRFEIAVFDRHLFGVQQPADTMQLTHGWASCWFAPSRI
jgi:hypothetical protein